MEKILVTGAAGFIGFHLCRRLIKEGFDVTGLDNINDYYSINLKHARLHELGLSGSSEEIMNEGKPVKSDLKDNFKFIKADLSDRETIEGLFRDLDFDVVVNLAAQAGVRYSLENPHDYTRSNIEGFLNVLEGCRSQEVEHLIYASSSSVYGADAEIPFNTAARVDTPVSLYAATKLANEHMAYTYSHLYGIPCTGLRFFTVYGPWGRPDMAYFKFAELMRKGKSIDVYNQGDMSRDFTYIDDIVESIFRLVPLPPKASDEKNGVANQLFNIGNGSPVNLLEFIQVLEKHMGVSAEKNMMPMQPGDVERTWADVTDLFEYIGYRPQVDIEEGIGRFMEWYKGYYEI